MKTKYETAIDMYDECVLVKDDQLLFDEKFDSLFSYLLVLDNFPYSETEEENEQIRTIVKQGGNEFVNGLRETPPNVLDGVYPLALIKMALKIDKLPICPTRVTQFVEFNRRYGTIIESTMTSYSVQ